MTHYIKIDDTQIRSILLNAVENAVKNVYGSGWKQTVVTFRIKDGSPMAPTDPVIEAMVKVDLVDPGKLK